MPGLWGGWSRRSTRCVQLVLCWGCIDVLKRHPSRHISTLFLGNASYSRPTCRSMCSRSFAPRHDFSVYGSYCIPEQRERDFELLGSRKSCTTACFVCGVKRYAYTSSPITVDSSNSFPSVRHLGTQGAHITRYPNSSWTVFAKSSERQLQRHG
jgi:hypothetical protein